VNKLVAVPEDWADRLKRGLTRLEIVASPELEGKILRHMALIREECQRVNLVSSRDRDFLIERHVIPSLQGLKFIENGPSRAICIGSGAGFPGVEVKLFREKMRLTLLEATKKKALFLEKVVSELGLVRVEVQWERAENITEPKYDIALARAVAPMPRLQEIAGPLLKRGGKLIAWKGSRFEEEMRGVKVPRFQVETVFPYAPPQIIVVFRKS
jgi:16S rRNA (guanine527-N7)-methyltransferase